LHKGAERGGLGFYIDAQTCTQIHCSRERRLRMPFPTLARRPARGFIAQGGADCE